MFSSEGIPLRATLTVALREYKTLDEQLAHLNLTSPDRTHSHVTQNGDTLSRIAAQYYRSPGDWRCDRRRQRHRRSAPARAGRISDHSADGVRGFDMPVVTLRDESKRQGDFYVPRFEIKIAGVNLPLDVLRDVVQVTYNDNVKELDSFELTVNNWDADAQDFKYVGAETADSLAKNPLHLLFNPCRHECRCLHGLRRKPVTDGDREFHHPRAQLFRAALPR